MKKALTYSLSCVCALWLMMGCEGAIDQIGKLTMVFGEDKTKGLNGAMLATGSAINVLGASSSAATGFITDFTSRMAGMAVNAKISQTDIMGYASALSHILN